MSIYYRIPPVQFEVRKTPDARAAIADLQQRVEAAEGLLRTRSKPKRLEVFLNISNALLHRQEINDLENSLERVAEAMIRAIAVPYQIDVEMKAYFLGPDEETREAARRDYYADLIAVQLAEVGGYFNASGYRRAIHSLLAMQHGAERSIVIGTYEDGTCDQGLFVLPGSPGEVQLKMTDYLQGLAEGTVKERPGMPDSAEFRVDRVIGVEDLMFWLSLLDPGQPLSVDKTEQAA